MNTRKTRNQVMSTVNELAEYIREYAPVKFGKLVVEKKIAPSTLYGYVRVMLDLCEDIQFEQGIFSLRVEKPQNESL